MVHTLSLARLSPNPTRGALGMRFTTAERGRVWVGLYDLSGRLVRSMVDNTLDAGGYDLQRDLSDVSPGVYFVRLWTAQATRHERLVIAR